jgi:high affinity sulfate transporter 1
MRPHLPLPRGLAGYRRSWLMPDLMAGLAIAAVALPSAIAYPAIAGLPPEVGLYSSIVPLVAYALLGPSRPLMIGPDAATMTVIAAVLATLSLAGPTERVAAASLIALGVGALCLLASRLRLGIVAAFLSRPILIGFISGISIAILIGQIGRFTGLKIESDGLIPPLLELARKVASIHWPSLALGLACFLALQLLAWRPLPVPGPLIVLLVAGLASVTLDFAALGIAVVGDLPSGLPTPALPSPAGLPMREVVLGALAVWLVSFGSGIVTARSFGVRGGFKVDADQELVGLGAANLASGLFSGFAVTVSDSRTATFLSVGGRSQAAGLVAALTLCLGLVWLSDALRIVPAPALGAILAAAALSLIDIKGLREIWRISRMEFVFALISMWGAISLGVLNGIVIAVGATLLYILLKEMRPHDALLGRIPGRPGFFKLHRVPQALPIPGIAICLVQGSLFFFNVEHVKARLDAIARQAPADTRWLVLDASAIVQLDTSAAAMLEEVRAELAARGILFGLAELHREPMELLRRAKVLDSIGSTMIFDTLEEVPRRFTTERHSA